MAERLNALVLKTSVPRGIGGSNPSFSAPRGYLLQVTSFFLKKNKKTPLSYIESFTFVPKLSRNIFGIN